MNEVFVKRFLISVKGSRKLEAHAELDRVLNEIAALNEELKIVEAEPKRAVSCQLCAS
jgi:hypothetical protein